MLAISNISMVLLTNILLQWNNFGRILTTSYNSYVSNTGFDVVDELSNNNRFTNMLYSIFIVIMDMMFSGIMEKTDQLKL